MDSIRLAPNGTVYPQIPYCRCAENTLAWDPGGAKPTAPIAWKRLAVGEQVRAGVVEPRRRARQ